MHHPRVRAVLTGTLLATLFCLAAAPGWKAVIEARDKGLPKTAIEALNPIIEEALKKGNHAEAIKAICTRIALEGNIEGNKPEEKITRLEAELAKAPEPMRPLMQAVLADWYWHYFQHNRWRFQQRTRTAEPPGKDFTTWDLPRLLAEIDRHFTAVLAQDKLLKATPIEQFGELLEKGTVPDAYRPTLYDFLAHEALAFYQAGEQGAAKAEDAFELDAESPVFGAVTEFLKWQPPATDDESPTLKAVRLFQSLLAFHENDTDKTAFIDVDLARLVFGKNQAVGPDKNARYIAALERFVGQWPGHEVSARALYEWGVILQQEEKLAEACAVFERGAQAFPKTHGGVLCHNMALRIRQPSLQIRAERVWNEPWPVITLDYKNTSHAFFRAVPLDFEGFLNRQRWGYSGSLNNLDWKEREKFIADLVAQSPAAQWEAALPPTPDFKEQTENVPVPKDLKPGFYFILASHTASFGAKSNIVSAATVWVSDLALVIRTRHDDSTLDGFVLKALTGTPLTDAVVRAFVPNKDGKLVRGPEVRTDANGLFRFTNAGWNLMVLAESGGQRVASDNPFYVGASRDNEGSQATVFFTDRSLYRPGQTIQYKGVCHAFNHALNSYSVLSNQTLTVVFRDHNNRELARQQRRCNDYGSFSGSFTAPGGAVSGTMSLRVEDGPDGSTFFNVEEYKRPKFQVELARPKEAARLNEKVTLSGKAAAYTGAAIGGAKVQWRVMREVQFPPWCWWARWIWPDRGGDQNIAHGTAVTGPDGAFTVAFAALPDRAIPEKSEPIFTFTVHADVTDSTGETRSDSRSVRVGYAALEASLAAAEWQTPDKPVEWTVRAVTLDGEPQVTKGTLRIHALQQPDRVLRPELEGHMPYFRWNRPLLATPGGEPKPDPANPDSWELGPVAAEQEFKTGTNGRIRVNTTLPAGIYRGLVEAKDPFGKPVTARLTLQVLDLQSTRYPVRVAHHFVSPSWSHQPGDTFRALWGTGYDTGRAFVEIERDGRLLRSFWTGEGRTQTLFEQPIGEEMRGGFTVRLTYVRENRAHLENRVVDVPWSNKVLKVSWERFTSKLEPGKKETWAAVITGPDAQRAAAEMVAALYDASLDQFKPHEWMRGFGVFRHEGLRLNAQFENTRVPLEHILGSLPERFKAVPQFSYRHYPSELSENLWGYGYIGGPRGMRMRAAKGAPMMEMEMAADAAMPAPAMAMAPMAMAPMEQNEGVGAEGQAGKPPMNGPREAGDADKRQLGAAPDLDTVAARKNLNETAFFFPHLLSTSDGAVRMEFTMPEALTEWKFLGFAHDRDLRGGFLTDKTVTAKDLMVEPNPPRFVREGDVIEFTVKVSNQSDARQTGKVRLTLSDLRTLKPMDEALGNRDLEKAFDLPPREARGFSWRLSIPDGAGVLAYKAVGSTGRLSDGEEGPLPVLSRRILVTESLPLPIRGPATKSFTFDKLLQSGKSDTLKHESLTVQMVSQPAWYAVMALPYLMEFPHECSEQVFNRLYANDLARFIAQSDPKIRRIFDLWKNTPALDSPLEKNQDLKSLLIEETPWLRQAKDESEARRNVGILFDDNRLNEETKRAFDKLAEMQLGDGLWPWFPGFRGDPYISLYIATGFARLRHLGMADVDLSLALKALDAIDDWMDEHYHQILKSPAPDEYVPSPLDAFYLYGRSFFLKDKPVAKERQDAVNFFIRQSQKFWLKVDCRQSQGHLAIGLKRFGDAKTPAEIMKSILERSVRNEELGLFWRDLELSWWWYRAPIETQALMIEALAEVSNDAAAVEEAKVWLLKQKQTQDWKTTKATADAVYALLLRGRNLLASDARVEVSLGGVPVKPEAVEAGTGFYEKRFAGAEVKPEMGKVTATKTDEGVSWGSVHWQYLEDMEKVTPYEGTPLKLKKALFRKVNTKKGQVLEPVKGAVEVGDELVCRVELRTDRDMEYVHLKDLRGSGTEPVNVLSQAKFQDGLLYYESTRDTASHFFIHYLPKGVYVFEYSVRAQLKGRYQTGVASVQCMYAPEFNSHSESLPLEVK